MKAYLRKAGIIAPVLLFIYIFFYMTSWRADKSFPEGPTDQELVMRKLDRIEQTLNNLEKLIEVSGQKSNGLLPKLDQQTLTIAVPKLYPNSILFENWGNSLPEEEQKEAEGLFQIYGYNAFLSNQLPLDRKLPDTRDHRCLTKKYPKDLPTISVVLIYINEALSVIKRAIRSIITNTPKHLLKEIILVDDHSTYNLTVDYIFR